MLNRKKHLDIYLFIMLLVTAAAVAVRTVAVFNELDFQLGHYRDTLLITVADWICIGGVILLLSYFALAPRGVKYRADFSGVSTYLPTALVAGGLIFLAVSLFTEAYRLTRRGPVGIAALREPTVLLPVIAAILALASIYYLFLNSYIAGARSERRASAAFWCVLFLCVYPAYLYFSTALPINAPNKIVDQMAYLFAAVFFLFETRISLGRDRWGAYVAFGLISSLISAYSAIPSLIVYFAKGELISSSIAESALTLSLLIFTVSRLITVRSLYNDEPCEVVNGILAKTREREASPAEGLTFAAGEQLQFEMSILESTEEAEASQEKEKENVPAEEGAELDLKEDEQPVGLDGIEELLDITEEASSEVEE